MMVKISKLLIRKYGTKEDMTVVERKGSVYKKRVN